MSRVFSCCSAKLASSLIIIIMMIMIIFAFFIGVSGQATSDFILYSPQGGFSAGDESIVACKVKADSVAAVTSSCTSLVQEIRLQFVSGESGFKRASADYPACDTNWSTDNGRCVNGSGGSGVYFYEFKFTPLQSELDNDNFYLRCLAQCVLPAGYPFTLLGIRPIPSGRPTTTPGPTTLPSTAGPSSSTAAPETGLCSEAFVSIGVSVVLVLLLGVATLVFLNALKKSKKAGPPAG